MQAHAAEGSTEAAYAAALRRYSKLENRQAVAYSLYMTTSEGQFLLFSHILMLVLLNAALVSSCASSSQEQKYDCAMTDMIFPCVTFALFAPIPPS